ncbi:MAG: FAD-dependent oxidoreductase, partial [Pseudomonadota bacterium]|nr:FAD-dependent oxidoreductase [Pseudomonadota bacterium]
MTVDVDVVVIGAGPAGMSCSGVLAQHNVNVVVLDEQNAPGGQIYKNIEGVTEKRAADLDFLGKSYAEGIEIANRFRAEDIDYRPGSSVWQISSSVIGKRRELIYSSGGKSQKLMAKYIVLATGAIERPIPVPGWTLPGVMTAGALQSLLKTSAVYPTGKLVIAGSGPLTLQLISQLMDANIEIAAFVDTTPAGSLFRAAFHL